MTIREFSIALFSLPNLDTTRHEQVRELTRYARLQLDLAYRDGKDHVLRTAARYLLDCHALLNRMDERNIAQEPSEKQKKFLRDEEIYKEAICLMLNTRDDILEIFETFHEKVIARWNTPVGPH